MASSTFGSAQQTEDNRSQASGHGANSGNSNASISATDAAQVNDGYQFNGGSGPVFRFEGPATASLLDVLTKGTTSPAASAAEPFDWQKILPYAAFALTAIGLVATLLLRKK